MFSLIKSVLKSIELWLSLKNKKFYYDLYTEHHERQDETIHAIEELRQSGDSGAADYADILRMRLNFERKQFEHISAFYAQTNEEQGD